AAGAGPDRAVAGRPHDRVALRPLQQVHGDDLPGDPLRARRRGAPTVGPSTSHGGRGAGRRPHDPVTGPPARVDHHRGRGPAARAGSVQPVYGEAGVMDARGQPGPHGEQRAPQIAESLLDLVGRTPLLCLNRVTEGLSCTVVAKLELLNPGGSVKDRPAVAMVERAEAEGHLRPGGTIVEPTSGNTGVGLAIVAAERGYRCIFV